MDDPQRCPYAERMSVIPALGAHMRDRFEDKGARHGLAYPWWIALIGGGGQILCVAVAVGQRGLFTPPEPATLALVLAIVPQALPSTSPSGGCRGGSTSSSC